MIKKKSKNSIYHFFLFSYIAILLVALSSGIVYAVKMHQQVLKETATSKQVALSSVQIDLESNLKYIQERGDTISFDSSLSMYIQYPELYSVSDAMNALKNKTISKNYILDAFIYLANTDEVITSTIRMSANKFFDIIYEFDGQSLADLKSNMLLPYHFHEYLPAQNLRQYNSATTLRVIPYMQSLPIRNFENPSAQLMLILDESSLFARAEALHNGTQSDVYVLNKNGTVMYSSPNAAIIDFEKLQGTQTLVNLDNVIVNRLVSTDTGWQYLLTTPYSLYYKDTFTTLLFVFGVFAIYLVVGIFLVKRLALRSYRPVKDIQDLLANAGSKLPVGHNEFEVIKYALLSQMKAHSELDNMLAAQQPAMLRDCVSQLIHGQIRDFAAAKKRIERLGVSIQGEDFLCVIAELDIDSPYFLDSDISSEESLSLARLIVQNVGSELVDARFTCQYLDLSAAKCLFIVNLSKDDMLDATQEAAQIFQNLLDFTINHFKLNVLFGISQVEKGLEGLPVCYDEAQKALEYTRYHAASDIVLFENMLERSEDYYYPAEIEQQLYEYLRSGNASEARELLNRLFDTNLHSRQLSSAAAHSFLYQLTATLQRIMNSNSLAHGETVVFDQEMVDKILKSSGVEHSCIRLHDLAQQIANTQQVRPLGKTEKLVEQIAEYINEHNDDAWLDLNNLSQQFNVTPQYISNIFKKYRNDNIKNYIAKRKLSNAKTLLETTDLPVREIAEKLGYANEIGIIRLFKKYSGMTPGDWRSRHKKQ